MRLHADELMVDDVLVRQLLRDQLPEHAGLPLRRLDASGSSNVLFELGPDLLVRLPRQPGGSGTILKEARWSPLVGGALPVATPYVVVVGRPGRGYPEHWSVVRRLPGKRVPAVAGGPRDDLARDLAAVVVALRQVEVPASASSDPSLHSYRADPLPSRDLSFRADIEACRTLPGLDLDLDAAVAVWEHAMEVGTSAPPSGVHWLHGDLLAENLLVDEGGRLTAVLDLGGLSVGDPTVDLAAGWDLFDDSARQIFRETVGADDLTWALGRGWALALAVMTFPYYWRTMPDRCARRLAMARRVLDEVGEG